MTRYFNTLVRCMELPNSDVWTAWLRITLALAQSLRVVTDLLIMICLHGICSSFLKKIYPFHCQIIIIC